MAACAHLFAGVLLGGCLFEDDVEREDESYDAATFSGAHVFGAKSRAIPPLAVGGRMDLVIQPNYGGPYRSFLAITQGGFEAAREEDRVTLRSQVAGDDLLVISDPDSDRIYGRFPLYSAPLGAIRLIPPNQEEERDRLLNPSPPRQLAALAGGPPARVMIALSTVDGRRLLDHSLTVRAPDGIPLHREPFWDVFDLPSLPAATPPIAIEVAAAGLQSTFEVTVVPAIDRIEAAAPSRPLFAGDIPALCFEALAGERAVQGLTWTFEAQNLTLFDSSRTPGCIKLLGEVAGSASITARAGGLSHTLSLTVAPKP